MFRITPEIWFLSSSPISSLLIPVTWTTPISQWCWGLYLLWTIGGV